MAEPACREMLALRWSNVDLDYGLLQVNKTVYDGILDRPKTNRSVRIITIVEGCIDILKCLQSSKNNPDDLVFANLNSRPLDRRNLLNSDIKSVTKRLGLPNIFWHCFRHCNATLLDTVQALLGHTSSEMTQMVYVHALPEDQRRAVSNIERLILDLNGLKFHNKRKLHMCNELIYLQVIGRGERI